MIHSDHDTIIAPATAAGGAIAVVRISGEEATTICDRIFRGAAPLAQADGYTVHYGHIADGERIVDDVLATVFHAPRSYTGEDSVEISCHGSAYIVSELLRLLAEAGARMAEPGEFTLRAYLAGKLDLSQAEAVADLIAASSRAAHTLAATQMRGSYSSALDDLREQLLGLTSLLELELDFSEEEVEFADRGELRGTMERIGAEIDRLRGSFALGNAIKEGVPVAIVGAPNVGKSTLLNRLLGEERAMVSEIAGTTRDVIEEQINIDGVVFRFLDTAGIRTTDDRLERMGIERTLASIDRARIIIRMIDATVGTAGSLPPLEFSLREDQTLLTVVNKIDKAAACAKGDFPPAEFPQREGQDGLTVMERIDKASASRLPEAFLGISAKEGTHVDELRRALREAVDTETLYHGDAVVSAGRHFEALSEARAALDRALAAFDDGLPADLLSEEIRQVVRHLGAITGRGAIAPEEVLQNIFSKFCIGK